MVAIGAGPRVGRHDGRVVLPADGDLRGRELDAVDGAPFGHGRLDDRRVRFQVRLLRVGAEPLHLAGDGGLADAGLARQVGARHLAARVAVLAQLLGESRSLRSRAMISPRRALTASFSDRSARMTGCCAAICRSPEHRLVT